MTIKNEIKDRLHGYVCREKDRWCAEIIVDEDARLVVANTFPTKADSENSLELTQLQICKSIINRDKDRLNELLQRMGSGASMCAYYFLSADYWQT
jgi:hypothetical protein